MYTNYGDLSTRVYEQTKPVGHSISGDIEYYTERINSLTESRDKKQLVLEAGVGTGRMLIPMLEEGIDIEGIDYSREMLIRCKENCDERNVATTLYTGNLMNFEIEHDFDVIILPTGSFSLLADRSSSLLALRNFHFHLADHGRLIFDMYLPHDFVLDDKNMSIIELSKNSGIEMTMRSTDIDWVEQTTTMHIRYEYWKKGMLEKTELQQMKQHWFGIDELHKTLLGIGFMDVTFSANYEFDNPVTSGKDIITVEAIKKPMDL